MEPAGDEHLVKALDLAHRLLNLADRVDTVRKDVGCGVVTGTLRDCAYKIEAIAKLEIEAHRQRKSTPLS